MSKKLVLQNPLTSKVYSINNQSLVKLPNSSNKNMMSYGIDSGKEVQLDVPFNRIIHVEDANEVLGSGKTFKHIIENTSNINKITVDPDSQSRFLFSSNDKVYTVDYVKTFKEQYPPDMTSNSAPSSYVASASSFEAGDGGMEPFKAFNSNVLTTTGASWQTSGAGVSHWLKIDFGLGNEKIIQGFHIQAYRVFGSGPVPNKIILEGSNDDVTFSSIYEFTPDINTWNDKVIYEFNNNVVYRYFRLRLLLPSSGDIMIRDFRLYEYNDQQNIVNVPSLDESSFINYGINRKVSIDLNSKFSQRKIINSDGTSNSVTELTPTSLKNEFSNSPVHIVKYSADANTVESAITLEMESFNVYEYISDTPTAMVYTESSDDIIISTTTEPYTIYEELGDEVEVLYYTDDDSVTKADLNITANWSPLDELEGDFEIVTWTDETADTVQRKLEMTAVPKPQFVKLVNKKTIYGDLKDVISQQSSLTYKNKEYVRILLSPDDIKWYTWDKSTSNFVEIGELTENNILLRGMRSIDLDSITDSQWSKWEYESFNVGIFLKDDERDTIISSVGNLSYKDMYSKDTSNISNSSLYVLNTKAQINVTFDGATLKGEVSDDDLTRVQYRVILNNKNYYPKDGSFTALGPSPQNINLVVESKDVLIGKINTLKVEFQDFFGTTDYWLTQFVGEYSGIMFADEQGKFYSSDKGDILNNLDFGVIIAGQTSLSQVVYVQNKNSFDIQNIYLSKIADSLPNGVELQISKTESPFIPEENLLFEDLLGRNEKLEFYVRLKTVKGSDPGFRTFDINVKADPIR